MSVRVVARIRPLLKSEIEKDIIVEAAAAAGDKPDTKTLVKIPNPKIASELYSFQFGRVYESITTQAELFENEVTPTVKQLFKGLDVNIFAYGVTGTGKTHTMRGGKSLADRGVIPRMLSSVYRRARKVEKDSNGETSVHCAMSYYEIYCDKIFDLFEENRTPSGLPIRDNHEGKAIVVGLSERPCTSLKEFEQLYDEANRRRSTSATKLNASSSRSHAVLCVKVTQTTGDEARSSTASLIDLAGSEDNRRTENNKERLVESSQINKSLFVLASCVEAISKKQSRIPYRESKMTRILGLGQKEGVTIMILNLAPLKSYHLDTLSSLNFANRAKRIEVNEIENKPFLISKDKLDAPKTSAVNSQALNRQPLRALSVNHVMKEAAPLPAKTKALKLFSVYTDQSNVPRSSTFPNLKPSGIPVQSPKRARPETNQTIGRPAKISKLNPIRSESHMSKVDIEALIERKVTEALAGRVDQTSINAPDLISQEVQKRLDALEKRVEGQESERAEGLQYLLMAKQHTVRNELSSALKMYQLALPHFPDNDKLSRKIAALQTKLAEQRAISRSSTDDATHRHGPSTDEDASYHEDQDNQHDPDEDESFIYRPRSHKPRRLRSPAPATIFFRSAIPTITETDDDEDVLASALSTSAPTPRTRQLLDIINTKDVSQIRLLKGVGAKKAELLVNCLCEVNDHVTSLNQLGKLRGVGLKTVENMRNGLVL